MIRIMKYTPFFLLMLLYFVFVACLLYGTDTLVRAQDRERDPRVLHLASRILDKVPDIPHTELALGRGPQERSRRALQHARAIVAAADTHLNTWQEFRRQGGWEYFNPRDDLPALIAAIAFRESAFQPVIRLDNNTRVYAAQGTINARILQQIGRADRGVMQVRAPSAPAAQCGVRTREDAGRLVTDLVFGYQVGTCVLTNRLMGYIPHYQPDHRHLGPNDRPYMDLRFYGVWGPRRGTADALRARELIILERYNWGGRDLYNNSSASGYARRVLTTFEFFRGGDSEGSGG